MSYGMMMDTEKGMERAVLKHIEGFAQALLDAVEETLYPDITVAVFPGRPMEIMGPEETEAALEKHGGDVVVVDIPSLDLAMSVHGGHIVPLEGHHYLAGDTCGVVHALDEDGEMTGLGAAEIYAVQMYLKENTVTLASDRPDHKCIAIRLD